MKRWFVIPITKEETVKIILISAYIIIGLAVIGMWESMGTEALAILIFLMFPVMFTFFAKDVYQWDWQIKIKMRDEE